MSTPFILIAPNNWVKMVLLTGHLMSFDAMLTQFTCPNALWENCRLTEVLFFGQQGEVKIQIFAQCKPLTNLTCHFTNSFEHLTHFYGSLFPPPKKSHY